MSEEQNIPEENLSDIDKNKFSAQHNVVKAEAHKHHKKHFKHYLFDFFMVFFAVFGGFLAENYREHIVEHERGIGYLRSLLQDVKTDTAKLSAVILHFQKKDKSFDTLINYFNDITSQPYPFAWMRNYGALIYFADFIYTDRTIQQLKNAGGLRLITDVETADSIINYDGCIKQLAIQETSVSSQENIVERLDAEILDHKKINEVFARFNRDSLDNQKSQWLLTYDKKLLGNFYNEILLYKSICQLYLSYLINAKHTADRFVAFLEHKYRFKNE